MVYLAAAFTALSCTAIVDAAPLQSSTLSTQSDDIAAEPEEIKPAPPLPIVWGKGLPTITVKNGNTGATADLRLYTDHGSLELDAMKEFMRVAATVEGATEPLDNRLVQLAFRAAYHFNGASMLVISATRKGAHGKHSNGNALDFSLEGVSAKELAKYIRQYPRAGIGIYTHPKTQYVHLDVREHSYHWVDASPPGETWREQLLDDPTQEERDGSYTPAMDLPEVAGQ